MYRMGRRARVMAATLVGVLALAMVAPYWSASAQHYDPEQELPRPTYLDKALTKLGRGVSNVLLGWAEIPVTFDEKLKLGRSFGYLIGVAPVLGTARAIIRTGTGVYEMVTFPVDVPDKNYEAIIEPEYIF